jgi:hypothetical protein
VASSRGPAAAVESDHVVVPPACRELKAPASPFSDPPGMAEVVAGSSGAVAAMARRRVARDRLDLEGGVALGQRLLAELGEFARD